jgi:helicase
VASGQVGSEAELEEFFQATFFGHTVALREMAVVVENVRRFLEEHEFLEPVAELRATGFGVLTSELYLDPMSAIVLRQALERSPINPSAFSLLAAVAATPDLPPMFLRRGEEAEMLARYTDSEPELLIKPEEDPLRLDLDLFLATLKTASVLESWVAETPLVDLTERFGIGAGDVRAKVEDAEWLLFGASRLAVRFQRRATRSIDELSLRVRYGVNEELLDLVRLKGVGRVRGRALFRAGFLDREALKGASVDRLETILKSRPLAKAVASEVSGGRRRTDDSPPSTPAPTRTATPPAAEPRRGPRRLDEFGPPP